VCVCVLVEKVKKKKSNERGLVTMVCDVRGYLQVHDCESLEYGRIELNRIEMGIEGVAHFRTRSKQADNENVSR